ncbi:MAG TPA: cytochrome c biogenesis protein CcdA, partial [Planctomycetota bacterium]|nr:cytochrome c biogenesis protein CcdA [Planctomycetota bacterium]
DIPKGWHIYPAKDQEYTQPTEFTVTPPELLKIDGAVTSEPKAIIDPHNPGIEILEDKVTFLVPLRVLPTAAAGDHKAKVTVLSQLCKEGICLLGTDVPLEFSVKVSGAVVNDPPPKTDVNDPPKTADKPPAPAKSEVEKARDEGLLAYFWLSLASGAVALLTPCVFPMVPITVSFFTKRKQGSRARSIRDATIFSLGIVAMFTLLGFFVSLIFGAGKIQELAADPYLNIAFATLFLALAMSLFGAFELQVPPWIMNKLNAKAGQGEGVGSLLLMGLVFALTSFTCTGPFLGAVLVSAAQGNWVWPMVGMLGFAISFSAPFFVLALFPALIKSLPKSGGWLNSVKVVMGFLEVAAAMKFISNAEYAWGLGVLTREVFLAAWIALALVTTIYLLGHFQMTHDTPTEKIGAIRVLFASMFLAVAVWLGTGLLGARLGELDSFIPPRDYPEGRGPAFGGLAIASGVTPKEEWIDDWDEGLARAKATGKPMFVDFTGKTCNNCRLMEENIFPQSEIQKLFKNYVLVKLYTDDKSTAEREKRNLRYRQILQDRYGVAALPYYAIVTGEGKDVGTFPGMTRKVEEFAAFLKQGITKKDVLTQR